jgi:hypothetical protein
MIKCPNCGSTAQVKLKEIFQAEKYVQITWVCGCGTEIVTRLSYEEYAQGKWKGGKGMTREEVIDKIIDTVEQCEGKEEDCENCAMCQFCLEYFCG